MSAPSLSLSFSKRQRLRTLAGAAKQRGRGRIPRNDPRSRAHRYIAARATRILLRLSGSRCASMAHNCDDPGLGVSSKTRRRIEDHGFPVPWARTPARVSRSRCGAAATGSTSSGATTRRAARPRRWRCRRRCRRKRSRSTLRARYWRCRGRSASTQPAASRSRRGSGATARGSGTTARAAFTGPQTGVRHLPTGRILQALEPDYASPGQVTVAVRRIPPPPARAVQRRSVSMGSIPVRSRGLAVGCGRIIEPSPPFLCLHAGQLRAARG